MKKTNSTCSFWLEVWQGIEKYQDEVAYILQQFQVSSKLLSCTLALIKWKLSMLVWFFWAIWIGCSSEILFSLTFESFWTFFGTSRIFLVLLKHKNNTLGLFLLIDNFCFRSFIFSLLNLPKGSVLAFSNPPRFFLGGTQGIKLTVLGLTYTNEQFLFPENFYLTAYSFKPATFVA